jgi:hypothetical protein
MNNQILTQKIISQNLKLQWQEYICPFHQSKQNVDNMLRAHLGGKPQNFELKQSRFSKAKEKRTLKNRREEYISIRIIN